jgi:hypothetical protein
MSGSFDFLGFRIQWHRKRGTSKWYVYTFVADRPIRSVQDKIRALTHRTSPQPPRHALIRLNQIMRDCANSFKHAVCKHTSAAPDAGGIASSTCRMRGRVREPGMVPLGQPGSCSPHQRALARG